MRRKSTGHSKAQAWADLAKRLGSILPHASAVWGNEDEFIELRVKARPDGTMLCIMKAYGADGGPMVCFGVGYGVEAALMAIDSTIQGNHWKVDKPWKPKGK